MRPPDQQKVSELGQLGCQNVILYPTDNSFWMKHTIIADPSVGDSSSGGDQGSVEGVRDILGDQAAAPTPTGDVNEHEDAGESTVGKGARKKNTMISRASSAVSHLSRSLLGLPVNPFSRRETLVGNAVSVLLVQTLSHLTLTHNLMLNETTPFPPRRAEKGR